MRTFDHLLKDSILTGHAVCAPSKAAQWMRCPFSIAMEEWARVTHGVMDKASDAALDGTTKHSYLNQLFQFDNGNIKQLVEIPEEHDEAVMAAYTAVVNALSSNNRLESEIHLKVGDALQTCGNDSANLVVSNTCHGTSDVVALDFDTKTLWIIDAKFGRIPVAPDSEQLKLYAIGALDEFKKYDGVIDKVKLGIIQPFVSHQLQVYEFEPEEIKVFAFEALEAVKKVIQIYDVKVSNAELCIPGPVQCQWCKAADYCRAYEDFLLESTPDVEVPSAEALAEIGITVEAPVLPGDMTLAKAYEFMKAVEKWGRPIESAFKARLYDFNEPIGGFELKQLRTGAMTWIEDLEPADIARDLGLNFEDIVKLETPSAVAKKFKVDVSELTVQGEPVFGIARSK